MIAWLVEALVASALLMLAVLALRVPVARTFGPQAAYALWALPALRLVMPPMPSGWTEAAALPIVRAGEVMAVLVAPAAAPAVQPAAALPWATILIACWATGAVVFFVAHWRRHRRFCAALLARATPVAELDGVQVVESPVAAGPLAFGTRRRFVAFPADFADRYDAEERDLALAHELGHHARGDLLANWAALAVLALHWFDPVAWRAFRAFRCDQELANDARVLAGRSRAERHVYACAIIKAAHGGAVSPACHLHTIADLKGRLRMLTRTRPSRRRAATGVAAVLALVAGGLVATASGTRAAAAVSDRIEEATGVELRAPAQPDPVVPAAVATASAASAPRRVRHVTVVRDGKATTYEGAAADAFAAANGVVLPPAPPVPPVSPGMVAPPAPPLPPPGTPRLAPGAAQSFVFRRDGRGFAPIVSERFCADGRDGDPRRLTLMETRDGKRVTVICRNRVAAVADAARSAYVRRNGLDAALASIETARASIRANDALSDDTRREALEGLDEAVTELREEMAPRD